MFVHCIWASMCISRASVHEHAHVCVKKIKSGLPARTLLSLCACMRSCWHKWNEMLKWGHVVLGFFCLFVFIVCNYSIRQVLMTGSTTSLLMSFRSKQVTIFLHWQTFLSRARGNTTLLLSLHYSCFKQPLMPSFKCLDAALLLSLSATVNRFITAVPSLVG